MCFLNFGRPRKSASLFALLFLFLASNFAFLRDIPVKSSLCMQYISERQTQPPKSHGFWRSHMLYASSGVNYLRCLLELAKWVQLLPAAGPAGQCGTVKRRRARGNCGSIHGEWGIPKEKNTKDDSAFVIFQIRYGVSSSVSFIVSIILDLFVCLFI